MIALELINWDEFVHYQRRANAVYAEAMRQFSVRSRDVLMNAQSPHTLWSTLKSAVFCSSSDSSLPPLIGAGGGLVCESVGKADMRCRPILMESNPLTIRLPVSIPLPLGHGR